MSDPVPRPPRARFRAGGWGEEEGMIFPSQESPAFSRPMTILLGTPSFRLADFRIRGTGDVLLFLMPTFLILQKTVPTMPILEHQDLFVSKACLVPTSIGSSPTSSLTWSDMGIFGSLGSVILPTALGCQAKPGWQLTDWELCPLHPMSQ